MKPDKLINILGKMDERLRRSEGEVRSASSDNEVTGGILTRFSHLKANVRRLSSKPDAITFEEVQAIDLQIDQLLNAAAHVKSSLVTSNPLHRVLGRIADDDAGLFRLTSGLKIGLNQVTPDDLLESTPGQKTAAFQYAYQDDVLVVIDQPLRANDRDREIADAAIRSAVDHGAYVLADLEGTNVSPRLRNAFSALQRTLESHANVVQIGQMAQVCGRAVNSDVDELSSSLVALLLGHVEMVFDAVSQFEDWRTFCENAAAVKISQGSVDAILDGTRALVSSLNDTSSVSPEVVESLRTVSDWVEGENADRRDVLALTRSVENLFSASLRPAFRYASDVGKSVREQSVKGVAAFIIGVALFNIAPIISKIPGAEWVQPAVTFVLSLGRSATP
ncbi:hypothetical protein [Agrobacterium fabrum]|uniref:hypothetical protein n=1 Tax=Agrobacterium fabrum TaxID=1176649 RepID=UPI00247380FB|nr:hypothetical protein [Agrobacterium fabrum]MDH6294710.1 hypothetical protein [Agrobacterium fabrum]